tara:strand:- start:19839 stop:20204 length:366 start_codon:yes stop_codon:yes gene_type:complete
MAKFIYSKLANAQAYHTFQKGGDKNALSRKEKTVIIAGGAGLMNKRNMTPHGVCTEVSDETFKVLETVPSFVKHLEGKFLSVHDKEVTAKNEEKEAANLNEDKSAPLTPAKLKAEGKKTAV